MIDYMWVLGIWVTERPDI